MSSGVPTEQRDANAEIIERLARIEAGVRATNGRVTALETWRDEHQPWSEQGRDLIQSQSEAIAAFETKLDRMATDVIRSVSSTLQAMVHEARDSAWKEDFRELYIEMENTQRAQRRREMKEDVQQVFGRAKLIVLYLVPFLTVVNVIGQWMNWW